jgi:hypothetical protein|tara:strand:- start:2152 stop:3150 length:999 start_codon:yes stop_codon:yes gene_type:complete
MFEYFYHEIMRRTIIGFGSLFNNIKIEHTNETDTTVSTLKVPLAYSPTQKFLARLEQQADLSKSVQITLPRMSFEMTGLNYDPSRKSTTTQTFLSPVKSDKKKIAKTYLPVPYNLDFELSVFTKLNDDMLQIVEQILPYFQPAYTMTVDLVSTIGEKRDIPIVLTSITTSDDYEGDFSTRRALIYTMRFTAKTYFYGPVQTDTTKDIIKKVTVGYVAGGRTPAPSREMTYSVTPRATRAYNDTPVTTLAEDVSETELIITVADASSITADSYIYIDSEEIYVESVQNNDLTVRRAEDGSTAAIHVLGTGVKNITAADNDLIEFGDNFGFDGF